VDTNLRQVVITVPERLRREVSGILESREPLAVTAVPADSAWQFVVLAAEEGRQDLLDALQNVLERAGDGWSIVVLPVEAAMPVRNDERGGTKEGAAAGPIREELYDDVLSGLGRTGDFIIFTLLASVVAAAGLLRGDAAVIIGAMVIAPMLSAHLAISLGAVLGERELLVRGAQGALLSLLLALAVGAAVGFFAPGEAESSELLLRTDVGWGNLALAFASGCAAALALLSGSTSGLVGVMVAVALLPPAVTAGVMIGAREFGNATGAFLLFTANVAALNVASQLVLLARGVRPRKWAERRLAARALRWSLLFWSGMLLLLLAALWLGVGFPRS